jgi:hypothetical protein
LMCGDLYMVLPEILITGANIENRHAAYRFLSTVGKGS